MTTIKSRKPLVEVQAGNLGFYDFLGNLFMQLFPQFLVASKGNTSSEPEMTVEEYLTQQCDELIKV